jgi:MYXO-CTERM domain-containing protein
MRSIRSAGAALTLAGIATIAGTAMPAFAAGPQIDVYPSVATPGQTVSFSIVCKTTTAKSAELYAKPLALGLIAMSPATHAGVFQTSVTVPANATPNTYSMLINCSDGTDGVADLTVKGAVKPNVIKPNVVKPNVVVPSGMPVTGDGVTSTAAGGPLTAVGVGVLGLSGLAGAFAIRRRKQGK